VPVRIVGGARAIRLERPAGTPVRLRLQGGTGSVSLDGHALGKKGGDVAFESQGWAAASGRYAVEVVGGSKSIDIVEGPG
jgi:hypothetical protein